MDGFCLQGELDLTLFISLRGIEGQLGDILNKRKSLMTGKTPLIIIVKLCKILAHFLQKCAEIEAFRKLLHWDYRIIEI